MHEEIHKFMTIPRSILLKTRNVADKVVEKIRTLMLTFSETLAVNDIMWKTMVKPEWSQMTI